MNQIYSNDKFLAVFDDGVKVPVVMWLPNQARGAVNGFGLFGGRMLNLEYLSGFVEYQQETLQ